jgi:uncharacterized membrane protein YbhN (UPF0104 family)
MSQPAQATASHATHSDSTRSSAWKHHWVWGKWVVATTLLSVVIWQNHEGIFQITQQPLDWSSLLTAFVLCGGAIILTFVRWFWLVQALGFSFGLRDALRLGFIGYLLNFVGPGAVGGDLLKATLLAKEQPGRRATAVATVLLDRILGLLALFVIGACAAIPLWGQIRTQAESKAALGLFLLGSVGGGIGVTLMLIPAFVRSRFWRLLARIPLAGKLIAELLGGVQLYQSRPRVLFAALGISVVGHFGMISSFYFAARAISGTLFMPDYLSHLFFIPAAEFVGVVAPVPGGVGALEWAVERFYQQAHAQVGTGIMTCVAYRVITLTVAMIGAGYYLTSRREIDQALHAETPGDVPPTPRESR